MTGEREPYEREARILGALFEAGTLSRSFEFVADAYAAHAGTLDATEMRFCAVVAHELDRSAWRASRTPTTIDGLRLVEYDDLAPAERIHARTYNRTLATLWRDHLATGGDDTRDAMIRTAVDALRITNARIRA